MSGREPLALLLPKHSSEGVTPSGTPANAGQCRRRAYSSLEDNAEGPASDWPLGRDLKGRSGKRTGH